MNQCVFLCFFVFVSCLKNPCRAVQLRIASTSDLSPWAQLLEESRRQVESVTVLDMLSIFHTYDINTIRNSILFPHDRNLP